MRNSVCSIFFMAFFTLIAAAGCTAKDRPDTLVRENVRLDGSDIGGITEQQAREYIERIAKKADGSVDVERTLRVVFEAREGENVEIVYEYTIPDKCPQPFNREISSASTPLLNRQEERVNNIRVASEVLDGIAVEPGEEFSFNEALGRRTREKGYLPAPIFIKRPDGSTSGYGVGGGICQVSSTLYIAVLDAGLTVSERHGHSKKVGYVPAGKDATVVYGGADFKFLNTRHDAVVIKVELDEEFLTVKLLEKAW